MKKYLFGILTFTLVSLYSCDEWLSVNPRDTVEAEEMILSYKSYKDMLTGCYIKMKARNLYGENLTITTPEVLAQLWYIDPSTFRKTDQSFMQYDYENTDVEARIKDMYLGLYNVIVQANSVLISLDKNGEKVITDPAAYGIIKGEAHALRAYCHLDILRLFGQMPKNPVKKVKLPYSEKVSFRELPTYYDYEQFTAKIESDLIDAENALKEIDPVFEDGMTYGSHSDNMLNYRMLDMNYYAVKALQARFYLYTDKPTEAYKAAKVIYDSIPVPLGGDSDYTNGYTALPGECLFALSNREIMDYSPSVLGIGAIQVSTYSHLHLDGTRYTELFTDNKDLRYLNVWKYSAGTSGDLPTLTKYYYDTSASVSDIAYLTKLQLMPMLRMSEVYLIMMETTTDLAEGNQLYRDYMLSKGIVTPHSFSSLDELKAEVVDEIRRELFGEGQMFFAYKRLGTKNLKWGTVEMTEDEYILPVPLREPVPSN